MFARSRADHTLSSGCPERLTLAGIRKEAFDCSAQRAHVVTGVDDDARHAVFDRIHEPTDPRRYDGTSVRHRLVRDETVALPPRWHTHTAARS